MEEVVRHAYGSGAVEVDMMVSSGSVALTMSAGGASDNLQWTVPQT